MTAKKPAKAKNADASKKTPPAPKVDVKKTVQKKTVKKATAKKTVQKSTTKKSAPVKKAILPASLVSDARTVVSVFGDDKTAAAVAEEKLVQKGAGPEEAREAVKTVLKEMETPDVNVQKKLGLAQRRLNEVFRMAIENGEAVVALATARELNKLECLYNKAESVSNIDGVMKDEEKDATRTIILKALGKEEDTGERLDDLARLLVFKYIERMR